MKCSKCKRENLRKANFCQFCGREFTKEEKEEEQKSTLIGKVKYWEDWIDEHTFKKYLEHPVAKILYVLAFLAIGLYNIYSMGSELKLLNGENYEVSYNTELDEYYIVTKEPPLDGKVYLTMYVPNKVDYMTVNHYSPEGNLLDAEEKSNHEGIILTANTTDNNYYTIKDNLEDSKELKVFIYYGGL